MNGDADPLRTYTNYYTVCAPQVMDYIDNLTNWLLTTIMLTVAVEHVELTDD